MKKRKITAVSLAAVMLISSMGVPVFAKDTKTDSGKVKISLGADLTDEQRNKVLSLLSLTKDDLYTNNVIYISNEEEHEYLDDYIDPETIGDKALSSSKVVLEDEGHGITVSTYNINYCTVSMYQSALMTAGVEDASVYVAGPEKLSGTAALIGVMKAYDSATDGSLKEDNVETAAEELAVTSQLGEILGDTESAELIIAQLKTELKALSDLDDSELDQRIESVAESYGKKLSEDTIVKIRKLVRNLAELDSNVLVEKAKSFLSNLTKKIDEAGGVGGILNSIGGFFGNLFSKISEKINN